MFHSAKANLGTIAASLLLSGCLVPGAATNTGKLSPFQLVQTTPANAPPESCWGNRVTPAIIETVEREVLVQPAHVSSDGRIQQPAIYRKERQQSIVQERQEIWTEVVCTATLTPDFVASLQRALAARGYYRGTPTGSVDTRTRNAIKKFQIEDGFAESTLTLATARKLGLLAVPRTPD